MWIPSIIDLIAVLINSQYNFKYQAYLLKEWRKTNSMKFLPCFVKMQVLVTSAVVLVIACSLLKEVEATRIRLSLNSLHEANMTTRKVSSTLYQTPCKKDGKINFPDGIKKK